MPPDNIPPKLLIIALCGRLSAQLALACGYAPVVVDCFADEDTRQLALQAVKVASLGLVDIQQAVAELRLAHGLTHLVYGSGFESYPETLVFLERDWVVLGNTAEVFKQLLDKQAFFRQLGLLGIPFPETIFFRPEDSGGWLQKPMQGQGGAGIRWERSADYIPAEDCYWQRYLQGESLSVTFIARPGHVVVLGFNRQWALALDARQPFLFAGIANCAELAETNQSLLRQWLAQLIEVYGLQGLGSLDFILKDGLCYVLEINARIPASAQLYDESLFTNHLSACVGLCNEMTVRQRLPTAYEIIYAPSEMRIAANTHWPSWVLDRPAGGAFIGKGLPICSIIADGKSPQQAAELLRLRRQFVENILYTGS